MKPSSAMLKIPARSQTAPPRAASRIGATKRGMEAAKEGSKSRSNIAASARLAARRRQERAGDAACDEQDDEGLHHQCDLLGHAGRTLHACGTCLDRG